MRRIFTSLFLLVTCYFFLVTPAHAEGEFSTSIAAHYQVNPDGHTTVSQTVTLTNLFSTIHAVSYSFIIQGTTLSDIRAIENGNALPVTTATEGNQTTLTLTFTDALVGKGKSRIFTIQYQDERVSVKNGQVWEINIPQIADIDKYENYNLSLLIPKSFSKPAYISPNPKWESQGEGNISYQFSKDELKSTGIVAAFGEFQVFEFELAYHLRNPHKNIGETEIALPPDTAFQRVYYSSLNPQPIGINLDEDGNWLAKYRLKPAEKLDIKARGTVQLFTSPQEFYPQKAPDFEKYLASTKYWQADNPQITELAKKLKTPREIYNFVVRTLSYNYSRVSEGVKRLGAVDALVNPENAICMEFTDLFIALSRAAGIPAREVNGYAYTENLKIQPLSLVADVLHAWPEYWDSEREIWVPVDPTWGNTTGGVDFFSKLDLNHFAFAIHGKSSEEPYPAGSYKLAENPQKDVSVYFGKLPENKEQMRINLEVSKQPFPFLSSTGILLVQNSGSTALYNLSPKITAAKATILKPAQTIEFLPPLTKLALPFSWQPEKFWEAGGEITAVVGETQIVYTIGNEFLIWRVFGIFLILTAITAVVLGILFLRWRLKKHEIDKHPEQPRRLPFQR